MEEGKGAVVGGAKNPCEGAGVPCRRWIPGATAAFPPVPDPFHCSWFFGR